MRKLHKKIALVLVFVLTLSVAMQKYDTRAFAKAPSMTTSTTNSNNVEHEDMPWDPRYPESKYTRTYVPTEYGHRDKEITVDKKVVVPAEYEDKTVVINEAWSEDIEYTDTVVDHIPETTEEYKEWVEATTVKKKALVPEHTETYKEWIPEKTVRDKEWIPERTETYRVRIPEKTVRDKRWIPEKKESYKVWIPGKTVNRKTWIPEKKETYREWIPAKTINKKAWEPSKKETYKVWIPSKKERRKTMTLNGWKYYYVTIPGRYETKTRTIPGKWRHYTETIAGRYETKTRTIPGKWRRYTETIPGRHETRTRTIPGKWEYYTRTIPATYETRTRTVGGEFRYYDRVVPGHHVTRTRTVPDTWRYYDEEVPGHYVTKTRIIPAHTVSRDVKKTKTVNHPAVTKITKVLVKDSYEKIVKITKTIKERYIVKAGHYVYNKKESTGTNIEDADPNELLPYTGNIEEDIKIFHHNENTGKVIPNQMVYYGGMPWYEYNSMLQRTAIDRKTPITFDDYFRKMAPIWKNKLSDKPDPLVMLQSALDFAGMFGLDIFDWINMGLYAMQSNWIDAFFSGIGLVIQGVNVAIKGIYHGTEKATAIIKLMGGGDTLVKVQKVLGDTLTTLKNFTTTITTKITETWLFNMFGKFKQKVIDTVKSIGAWIGKGLAKLKEIGDEVFEKIKKGLKGTGKLTSDVIDNYISKAVKNPTSDKFVLGVTGSYDTMAKEMGYTYFKMSNEVWDELVTEAAQNYDEIWKVNEKFLDDQIAASKEIILSNDPNAKYLFPDGKKRFFQRELDYLTEKGYTFSQTVDGLWKATK